jgi:proline dehydrogenase
LWRRRMMWFNRLVAQTLPVVPKSIVRRVSARYIAGETLDDAVRTVRGLNRAGMMATLDVLGEFVSTEADARRAAEEYLEALRVIDRQKLDTNVSIKLTQMGLKIDLDLCFEITDEVVVEAERLGNYVRIDMEDSSCTDDTLEVYRQLVAKHPRTVGCAIQSYLKRSADDIRKLNEANANVRLCKGIYIEPPHLAFRTPAEVNASYVSLLGDLLREGSYAGIATHDVELVEAAYGLIEGQGLDREAYEFQMLLGVQEALRQSILERGHRLRVYVPFGSHWYAYSLRRLKENPQIAGHVLRGFLNGKS